MAAQCYYHCEPLGKKVYLLLIPKSAVTAVNSKYGSTHQVR